MKTLCCLLFLLGGQVAVSQSASESQRTAVLKSSQISDEPNLSDKQRVTAIMERTLTRGRSTLPDGVTRITFVSPSNSDRDAILAMGTHAVATLGDFVSDPNDFAQLIAVGLLSDLGLPETYEPLSRALHPTKWQPVRVSALYGIAKLDKKISLPVLEQSAHDSDPKVRETAREILSEIKNADAGSSPN